MCNSSIKTGLIRTPNLVMRDNEEELTRNETSLAGVTLMDKGASSFTAELVVHLKLASL